MPADYPDEADDHPDRNDAPPAANNPTHPTRPEPDFSARQEAYTSLRLAVSTEQTTTAHQTAAADRAAYEKWTKDSADSRSLWSEYQHHWPETDRPQVDRSQDPPGSWRGEGERFLDVTCNRQVEAVCDRIAGPEQEKISQALRAVEVQDPDRRLVGFEERLKRRDRIKEKVCDRINELNLSPEEAVSSISDVIRCTFEYRESHYTQGVWADIGRLKAYGFKLHKLKNNWTGEEYKGINSQWVNPDTGQRFEVQFHTRISFEAKQLTHDAYVRLRSGQAGEFEKMVLKAFGRKVSADVPIPEGATDISDYSEEVIDAR